MHPTLLSQHFSISEAIRSAKANELRISNAPSAQDLEVMRVTAAYMEIVRAELGYQIDVSSWYRSGKLNAALPNSSKTSQHLTGEAVDFKCPLFGTPVKVVRAIAANPNIPFDQLILEPTWIHISFSILECKPKRQVLTSLGNNKYATGITDIRGNPL